MPRPNPKNLPCMPNGDFEASMWLEHFAQNISEDTEVRTLVGISDAQCTELTNLAKDFHEKLFIAKCPSSNTSPNVEAKTLARNAAVIAAREMVNAIKAHPEVTHVQIVKLNLESRDKAVRERARKKARTRLLRNP